MKKILPVLTFALLAVATVVPVEAIAKVSSSVNTQCDTVRCGNGQVCEMRAPEGCKTKCTTRPTCVNPGGNSTLIENPSRCPENEQFHECGTACEPTCANPDPKICTMNCIVNVCQCSAGFVRNSDGKCVKKDECKQKTCGVNESLKSCGTACEPSCDQPDVRICTKQCLIDVCQCDMGFVRDKTTKQCVKREECAVKPQECPANEEFRKCGTACEPSCTKPNPKMCTEQCLVDVCQCKQGFVRDAKTKKCVQIDDCDGRVQRSTPNPNNCPANEVFQQCGTACEPSCSNPNPTICTLQCIVNVCQCAPGFVRDPITNSCVKQAECAKQCPANEVFQHCGTACEPTCANPKPSICTFNCITDVCQCANGFVREPTTKTCVKQEQCKFLTNSTICDPSCDIGYICELVDLPCDDDPPGADSAFFEERYCPQAAICSNISEASSSITCANVRCGFNTICQMLPDKSCLEYDCPLSPQCVPPTTPSSPCDTIRCGFNTVCEVLPDPTCTTGNCPNTAQCVAKPSCETIDCATGLICKMVATPCFAPPCPEQAQCVKPEGNQTCPSNESWRECATHCEPTCATKDIAIACIASCAPAKCQCDFGFYRNNAGVCVEKSSCPADEVNPCAFTTCLVGTQCVVDQPLCKKPPCPPQAKCIPIPTSSNCSKFEEWKNCSTCEPSCSDRKPICNKMCGPGKCQCAQGFFRNDAGLCVTENDCDAGNEPTCELIDCQSGMICQMVDIPCFVAPCKQEPKCVPVPTLTCANVLCAPEPKGLICEMAEPENCVEPHCQSTPTCLPREFSCQNKKCAEGEQCHTQQVTCVMAPCYPVAECRKIASNPSCDTVKCASGTHCELVNVTCVRAPCPPVPQCVNDTKGNQTCPSNESWKECATHCEPSCATKDMMMKCIASCAPSKCQCNFGFYRNNAGVCVEKSSCPADEVNACAATTCPVGSQCVIDQPLCKKPPCIPHAKCIPIPMSSNCSKFEEWKNCSTCEPSCNNKQPICNKMCGPGKCQCAQGFYRNDAGLCVTENDCDVPTLTCANVLCAPEPKGLICEMAEPINCSGSKCQLIPTCLPKEFSCQAKKCAEGEECHTQQVICVTTPCYPIAECRIVQKCPTNEIWRECATHCEPKCDQIGVQLNECIQSCAPPACQCDVDFYRNDKGVCVPKSQCQPVSTPSCDNVRCASGTHCELVNVTCVKAPCLPVPQCVNDTQSLTCANVLCAPEPKGQICEMAEPENCIGPNCKLYPTCLPKEFSCQAKQCSKEEECHLKQVTCVKEPCYPVAECRKIASNPNCDTVKCASGTHCELVNVMCVRAPCPPVAHCVNDNSTQTPSCKTVKCSAGFHCELVDVICVKAPCPPQPQCVTDDVVSIYNCANITCPTEPAGLICEMAEQASCAGINCPKMPTCIPKENSCEAQKCAQGEECHLHQVTCIRAPCYPVAECRKIQKCPVNETWLQCASHCEPNCAQGDALIKCVGSCAPSACQCNANLWRNDKGICVPKSDCGVSTTPSPSGSCMTMKCSANHHCEMVNVTCVKEPCYPQPQCVPDMSSPLPPPTCMTVKCSANHHCEMVNVTCVQEPCYPQPQCVPDMSSPLPPPTCMTVKCSANHHCEMVNVTCVKEPCYPQPQCVPDMSSPLPPPTCMTVKCSANHHCEMVNVTCVKEPCYPQPQCVPDMSSPHPPPTCMTVKCSANHHCEMVNVTCIKEPCYPQPQCVPDVVPPPTCPVNQTWAKCPLDCEVSCDTIGASACGPNCAVGKCTCASGFIRNFTNGNCIKREDCPIYSCDRFNCDPGFICKLQSLCNGTFACPNPKPKCVLAEQELPSCNTVKCSAGTHCELVNVTCVKSPCLPQPQCVPDSTSPRPQLTCMTVKCAGGSHCEMVNVTCVKAPCDPQPQCVPDVVPPPSCPVNQTWAKCPLDCEVSCDTIGASVCGPNCAVGKCACASGFIRNFTNGNCIKREDCPIYSCDGFKCDPGFICKLQALCNGTFACPNPKPKCVLIEQELPSCNTVKCSVGTHCELKNVTCVKSPCPPQPQCVPDLTSTQPQLTCMTVKCSGGSHCEMVNVTCIKAPCNPQPQCVPDVKPDACATMKCSMGYKCAVVNTTCIKTPCSVKAECVRNEICPSNEEFHNCSSMCEPQCNDDGSKVCSTLCGPPRCQCNTGYARDNSGICVPKAMCNNSTPPSTTTVKPKPETCKDPNQIWSECPSMCEAECGKPITICPAVCTPPRCICKPNFILKDGKCVPLSECPNNAGCAVISCQVNTTCKMDSRGSFYCIPNGAEPGAGPMRTCRRHEIWRSCGGCEATCQNPNPICARSCATPRCQCKDGLVRINGKCQEYAKCGKDLNIGNSTCPANEMETDCMPQCEGTCRRHDKCSLNDVVSTICKSGCICRPFYKRDMHGQCTHVTQCHQKAGCKLHEKWTRCIQCENTCELRKMEKNCSLTHTCLSGCGCKKGFFRNSNGTCVRRKECNA